MRRKKCLECHKGKPDKNGLCRSCYNAQADFIGPGELPEPTDAMPGSKEKERILAERLEKKQKLHHPKDRKIRD